MPDRPLARNSDGDESFVAPRKRTTVRCVRVKQSLKNNTDLSIRGGGDVDNNLKFVV